MAVIKDLTGQRFGRLVAVSQAGKANNGNAKWLCKCDCGGEKVVASWGLKSGQTQSCGCIKREQNTEMFATHGDSRKGNRTRLYNIWAGMKNRCYNKRSAELYGKYGKRGISVCNEWRESYTAFREWALSNGYNDSLTIDRIDPSGDYCPENCRWATQKQQQNNRTNNHYITFCGETKTMAEWGDLAGFGRSVLEHRLSRGWTVQDALMTPRQSIKNGKRIYVPSKLETYAEAT